MRQFIIINGKEVFYIHSADLESARNSSINICDHSQEIIVREIETVTDLRR